MNMAHMSTAHVDGDRGEEGMLPMGWSPATNSAAALNVPQQAAESQSLKLNLRSRLPSHSAEEGSMLPVLSPKTPNLMPEYPEMLQYGQNNPPDLMPSGMEALDSFGAVTSNVVYADNNMSTEGFPQSFQTVEHISPLPGDIHGMGLTPVGMGPAPGSLFVQSSKDGSGLSTIIEHQHTESLSPRGMAAGYGPVSPGYQAFVSADQPPLPGQQSQAVSDGFPAGMGFGSPQVSAVAKGESFDSKQSSSMYPKPRGSRKKTLSLNTEEREALENLIEEVLIDGVADSDEASISSDGDEEGGSSGKEQTHMEGGGSGSNKDIAGKEGMPKIYPAQLKVAVKHMRNLPPRFMRRLENAQKKIDAAEKQEQDKAREERARAESEAMQREQVRIRVREDQKREKKKEIRNLLDDLDQYTDEQSLENKIGDKKEKPTKAKGEKTSKDLNVSHTNDNEATIQESSQPIHVGLSKSQGNVKPQIHDITNELAQKLLGQKLVSGPLPPAIQPNAVNCEDLERQFLGEPAIQMDSAYGNQVNIARHMAANPGYHPYGYSIVQNLTEPDQRTHLSVDAPEFVPYNSFGAISSHVSVAQPSQYMPVPGSQIPMYTSSPVIYPDSNPLVPNQKIPGATFKPVSKEGPVKSVELMRTKSSSPFQAPLGRHSPQMANVANVGRLSPQVVASSSAAGQPLHIAPSSLASEQVPHSKNAPYMLPKHPTNIPPPTIGVPPAHGVGVLPMNPYPMSYNLPGFHPQGYPLCPPFLPPHGYMQWPGDGGLDKHGQSSSPLMPHPLMGIPLKASPQMVRKGGGFQHHGHRQAGPGPRHTTPNKAPPSDVKLLTAEAARKLVQQLLSGGLKVMVILRGCAGSGKSTVARALVFDGVCLSTDEYFVNPQGDYVYDFGKLSEAHAWNQNRAKRAVESGKNPVIIDNTNTQSWEMKVYVSMATNNGYHVEIIEPDTPWRHNAKELANRNTHGVTLEAIRKMLDRYEHNVTLQSILGVPIKKPEETDKPNQLVDGDAVKKTPRRRKKKKRKRNRRRDKSGVSADGQTKEDGHHSSDDSSEDDACSSKSTTPSLPPIDRTASLSNTEHETSSPRDTTPEVADRGDDVWSRKNSSSPRDTTPEVADRGDDVWSRKNSTSPRDTTPEVADRGDDVWSRKNSTSPRDTTHEVADRGNDVWSQKNSTSPRDTTHEVADRGNDVWSQKNSTSPRDTTHEVADRGNDVWSQKNSSSPPKSEQHRNVLQEDSGVDDSMECYAQVPNSDFVQGETDGHNDASNDRERQNLFMDFSVTEENESLKERLSMNGLSPTTATSEDYHHLVNIIKGLRILDELKPADIDVQSSVQLTGTSINHVHTGDYQTKDNSESTPHSDLQKPVNDSEQCVSSDDTSETCIVSLEKQDDPKSADSANIHSLSNAEISREIAQFLQEQIMEAVVKREFQHVKENSELDNAVLGSQNSNETEDVQAHHHGQGCDEQSELPDVHTDSEDDSKHKDGLSDIHHSLQDIDFDHHPYEADLDIDLDNEYGLGVSENITEAEISRMTEQMQELNVNSQPVDYECSNRGGSTDRTESSNWESNGNDVYSVPHAKTESPGDSQQFVLKDEGWTSKDNVQEPAVTKLSWTTTEEVNVTSSTPAEASPKPKRSHRSRKWRASNSESESSICTEDETATAVTDVCDLTEGSLLAASESSPVQDQPTARPCVSQAENGRYPFVVRHDLDPQSATVAIKEKTISGQTNEKDESTEGSEKREQEATNANISIENNLEAGTVHTTAGEPQELFADVRAKTAETQIVSEVTSKNNQPDQSQNESMDNNTTLSDSLGNLQSNPYVRPKVRTPFTTNSPSKKKSTFVKPDVREKLLSQDWSLPKGSSQASSCSSSLESLKQLPVVKTAPMSTQTSPRDYSFVQKLEHSELDAVLVLDEYNIQGILQARRISSILGSNLGVATEDLPVPDNSQKHPFREKFHKGCQTVEPDMPKNEDPDLEEKVANLQMCFPEVSREDLLHILYKCTWDVEWASNILLDGGGVLPKTEPNPEEEACEQVPSESYEMVDDVQSRFELPSTEEPRPLQKYKSVSSLEDTSLELTVCPSKSVSGVKPSIFDDQGTYADFTQSEVTVTHDPPPLVVMCHEKLLSQEITTPEDNVLEQMANTSLDRLRSIEEFHHQHISDDTDRDTQGHAHSSHVAHAEEYTEQPICPSSSSTGSAVSQLDDFRLPPPVSRNVDSPQRATSPKKLLNGTETSGGVNLRLTPQLAHQLIKMFGPVQVPFAPMTLADEDLNVWLDRDVAQTIHKCWADTLLSKLADTDECEDIQDDPQKQRLEDDEALARQLQEEEYKLAKQNSSTSNTSTAVQSTNIKPVHNPRVGSQSSSISGSTHSSRESSPAKYHCPSPARIRPRDPGLLSSREGSPAKYHSPLATLGTPTRTSDPPPSLRDIMNEEMALEASRLEYLSSQEEVKVNEGTISTRLKWQQLTENFPGLDPQLLDEVFQSTGYNLESTIHTIETTMDQHQAPRTVMTHEAAVRLEEKMFRQAVEESLQHWPDEDLPTSESLYQALEEPAYDDFRAEAKMHFKLRQECFNKAASAYQSGMKDVASFYSQQGHIHSEKLRQANHRAAEKIVEVKNYHIANTNSLDLHGLHVDEAVLTLERILAKRETEQRENPDKRRNTLSVVTGRGNRSRGGVPKIRPAVIDFLKTNNYKWTEPTPSIIKVHLKYRFL